MASRRNPNRNATGSTTVLRHTVNEIYIYEVKESELDKFDGNRESDLFLEIAIGCVSACLSLFGSIASLDHDKSQMAFIILLIIAIITGICSLITGLLWYRKRSELKDIVAEIKNRPIQKK